MLNWGAVRGACRARRRGRTWHCFASDNGSQKMTLTDGTPLSPTLWIGTFAEKTLVCGVMAGLGSAMLTGGHGAHVRIEAVGSPTVTAQAFYAQDFAGALGRAHARHAHRPADDRLLRWGRTVEAELVRGLPSLA
ncbi:MAG TPA: hypothetical protein VFC03_13880 [Acidimicrobiales bacterium]|nr:hypothetical protein [Acidimicrobiales bacterium]